MPSWSMVVFGAGGGGAGSAPGDAAGAGEAEGAGDAAGDGAAAGDGDAAGPGTGPRVSSGSAPATTVDAAQPATVKHTAANLAAVATPPIEIEGTGVKNLIHGVVQRTEQQGTSKRAVAPGPRDRAHVRTSRGCRGRSSRAPGVRERSAAPGYRRGTSRGT